MKASRRIFAHWQNWVGLLLVSIFIFIAVAAPVLAPRDPENPGPLKIVGKGALDKRPHPPSLEAPLGTLPGQVSVYHALVWGTRSALVFGLATVIFTAVIGMLIGTASAYFGGLINGFFMRMTDAFLAFPVIAGVVFIQQMISIALNQAGVSIFSGPQGIHVFAPEDLAAWLVYLQEIDPVMIALILFSWPSYARIMNTVVRRTMQTEYVQAVRALGGSASTIMFRHLIPNSTAPIIVLAARDIGGMVLLQATFTFIGMGGGSLWGMVLVGGRDWIIGPGGSILTYWWLFLPATLALTIFGIGWNQLGDFLNDALNPRMR